MLDVVKFGGSVIGADAAFVVAKFMSMTQ